MSALAVEEDRMNDIERTVRRIVAELLGLELEDVTADAHFVEDLGADSLSILELMLAFKQELGCEIPDHEARRIETVSQAVAYIGGKR